MRELGAWVDDSKHRGETSVHTHWNSLTCYSNMLARFVTRTVARLEPFCLPMMEPDRQVVLRCVVIFCLVDGVVCVAHVWVGQACQRRARAAKGCQHVWAARVGQLVVWAFPLP